MRPVLKLASRFALVLSFALPLAGCKYDTAKPEEKPRYRTLGPKAEFPAFLRGTFLENLDVAGTQPMIVSGYGVLVNLPNTGRDDGIPTAVRESILDTASIRGVASINTDGPIGELSLSQFLADPRTSVVRVDGIVPPGARRGDRIDIRVSVLPNNTTSSIVGGTLYQTELHTGIVTPQSPGERVNKVGVARGPVLVNPVYAMEDPFQVSADATPNQSLRTGIIPDGGVYQGGTNAKDRFFVLKLRDPSYRGARLLEQRINYFFGSELAAAQDEGIVLVRLPQSFADQWEHFINLAVHLYPGTSSPATAVQVAEQLSRAALEPGRTEGELASISYAWEGLGRVATGTLLPLLSDPNPAVSYYAARAAANHGDAAAVETLVTIGMDPKHPYNVSATETLGSLAGGLGQNTGASLSRKVRRLLDSESAAVRVAAYQALLRLEGDLPPAERMVRRVEVGGQFYVDLVPSEQEAVVWASRRGVPRIAIIGNRPELKAPMTSVTFGTRLTISRQDPQDPATIYHRPVIGQAQQVKIAPDVVELVARMGAKERSKQGLFLTYGEVLAVLTDLAEGNQMIADGKPVPLMLEEPIDDGVQNAPVIPGLENLDDLQSARTSSTP